MAIALFAVHFDIDRPAGKRTIWLLYWFHCRHSVCFRIAVSNILLVFITQFVFLFTLKLY